MDQPEVTVKIKFLALNFKIMKFITLYFLKLVLLINISYNSYAENSETYGITQNGEEKKQTESPAPYGEKHQIAQTPEWIGS